MSWLTLSDVAEMTGGTLLQNKAQNIAIDAVSIDTRTARKDDLFIAIKGDRFDAHHFVKDLSGKVAAALVSEEVESDVPQVLVDDTRLALAQLAGAWRERFTEVVIGLTGSNGKTTLKEMLSAILSEEGNVLATIGNLNNDIGMPLTILKIREEHDYAVIEMGANHFGEIDFLTAIAKPDIAVVNNAGPAHLEGFGDVEGVSRAKGEIFNGLSAEGIAIINADDEYSDYWKSINNKKKILTFGLINTADVSGEYRGNGLILIKAKGEEQLVQLALPGKHNAMNALAATTVAVALGVELGVVKKGLESLQAVPGRLTMIAGIQDSRIIDDTYNANPASASAAIDVLAEAQGARIMVLGDMGELGSDADTLHGVIGLKAKHSGIEKIFCLGEHSAKACQEFGSPETVFDDMDELIQSVKESIENINSTHSNKSEAEMTILVKGSRSAHMERVVTALSEGGNDRC